MSYLADSVFQTVEWLRGDVSGPQTIGGALAEAWRDWAGASGLQVEIHPGFTNYKPFERARIVAEARLSRGGGATDAQHVTLLLQVFADPQAALSEFDEGTAEPPAAGDHPPPLCLPGRSLVVWVLPKTPHLRELQQVMDPEGFRSLLPPAPEAAGSTQTEAPALFRYVPCHRALLTWDGSSEDERLYVKIIASGTKAAAAALNLRELHARGEQGEFGFSVPRLVRYSPDLHTLIMTEVPGRSFTDVIGEVRPPAFEQLGVALGELHGMPAMPTDTWSLHKELADLRRHMAGIKRALPDLGERLEAVLHGLEQKAESLPAVTFTPIQGNLFGDQILYHDGSDKPIGIVDWDSWCYGDPHVDLGRLISHTLYVAELERLPKRASDECITALIAGYEQTRGRRVQGPWLEWHIATSLLLRAKICSLRSLADGWPGHFDFAVSEAERCVRGERLMPAQIGTASFDRERSMKRRVLFTGHAPVIGMVAPLKTKG